MNLAELKVSAFRPLLRLALERGYPRHRELDYDALFIACTERGTRLWREKIVPEIGLEKAAAFEKALWRVRMRAETSIPWPMGFGYAFGAACHSLAGGGEAERDEAATTTALYMFVLGLFDHMLDDYPQEFGAIDELFDGPSLSRWVVERDLGQLTYDPRQTLAAGVVQLYRIYLARCHQSLDTHGKLSAVPVWLAALKQMHKVEAESVNRRISQAPPTPALVTHAELPSTYAFWALAISACLGLGDGAAHRVEGFARNYARLTWLVDDVVDLEKDIKNDVWSGLAVRLALEARTPDEAIQVIDDTADECAKLLGELNSRLANVYWQPGDPFTLGDVLWFYVWVWAGGRAAIMQEEGSKAVTGG